MSATSARYLDRPLYDQLRKPNISPTLTISTSELCLYKRIKTELAAVAFHYTLHPYLDKNLLFLSYFNNHRKTPEIHFRDWYNPNQKSQPNSLPVPYFLQFQHISSKSINTSFPLQIVVFLAPASAKKIVFDHFSSSSLTTSCPK